MIWDSLLLILRHNSNAATSAFCPQSKAAPRQSSIKLGSALGLASVVTT